MPASNFAEQRRRAVATSKHDRQGAVLLYYLMLAERRTEENLTVPEADFHSMVTRWWDASAETLRIWELDEFLDLARAGKALRSNDEEFLRGWQRRMRACSSSSQFCSDSSVRQLITTREKIKRPKKSRLRGGRYLENWKFTASDSAAEYSDPARLPYGLDYRAGISSLLLSEILEAF